MHDVKKKQELLDETLTVLPDSRRRLEAGVEDLRECIAELGESEPTADHITDAHTEISAAEELLAKV